LTGVEKLIAAAGGQGPIAEAEGVTQQAVSYWVTRGWLPLSRARRLGERYGVPAVELVHPDVRDLVAR